MSFVVDVASSAFSPPSWPHASLSLLFEELPATRGSSPAPLFLIQGAYALPPTTRRGHTSMGEALRGLLGARRALRWPRRRLGGPQLALRGQREGPKEEAEQDEDDLVS